MRLVASVRLARSQLEVLWGRAGRSAIALIVFGSVARGDDVGEGSDLDVLLVTHDDSSRRSLQNDARTIAGASLIVMSPSTLRIEARRRPSFVAHLIDEGLVTSAAGEWDLIAPALQAAAADKRALRAEINTRARRLDVFSRIDRFAETPVTLLSHLYTIARSLVIPKLLLADVHEYSWRRVFTRFGEVHPSLKRNAALLSDLRPFYDYARGRTTTKPVARYEMHELEQFVGAARALGCA